MNCLIIEDEKVAGERLKELIVKYDGSVNIEAIIQSVKSALDWLTSNPQPDLIFMDIQLADGLSFEIFEKTIVNSPIIFTTAYEEYTLKAFKVNSIDYLLKPIDYEELKKAIDRFRNSPFNQHVYKYPQQVFDKILHSFTREFKNKFVIKVGEHIRVISGDDILCFYSMEKSTFIKTVKNRDYSVGYSLDQLEELIDPAIFFRINRQYIVSIHSLKDIVQYSNSRLLVKLLNYEDNELIVSREKVNDFKSWLEG